MPWRRRTFPQSAGSGPHCGRGASGGRGKAVSVARLSAHRFAHCALPLPLRSLLLPLWASRSKRAEGRGERVGRAGEHRTSSIQHPCRAERLEGRKAAEVVQSERLLGGLGLGLVNRASQSTPHIGVRPPKELPGVAFFWAFLAFRASDCNGWARGWASTQRCEWHKEETSRHGRLGEASALVGTSHSAETRGLKIGDGRWQRGDRRGRGAWRKAFCACRPVFYA